MLFWQALAGIYFQRKITALFNLLKIFAINIGRPC